MLGVRGDSLPLVGRAAELTWLRETLTRVKAGHGATVILYGESGVGKTRLVTAAAEVATREGWSVSIGRAYPMEAGVPYACFADALLPLLRSIDPAALATLTRGGTAELASLFPALAPAGGDARGGALRGALRDSLTDSPAEVKSRLLWNFQQFLIRYAAKEPMLIVLENLQWADASSLELLHFTARQIEHGRIVLLCTYNETERELNPALRTMEMSLVAHGAAVQRHLEPLTPAAVDELLSQTFGAREASRREFAALLYGWTRGNPFFVEETLKALVSSGRLFERDGEWLGWEVSNLGLPRTIRDAVVSRLGLLSPAARALAELIAVIGTRARYGTLALLQRSDDAKLLAALDELRHAAVIVESEEEGEAAYDFTHPTVRDTLSGELGVARAKVLHAAIAEGLEQVYGARAADHADELAYHYARADARRLVPKAVAYLTAAGRRALAQYANREAADYLSAALEHLDGSAGDVKLDSDAALVEDLAQARQRLGEYDAAQALWERALAAARALYDGTGDLRRVADIERRAGLASHWSGRHEEALAHYDVGLDAAVRAGERTRVAALRLAKGMCFHVLGDPAAAEREIEAAGVLARDAGDSALLARAHRAQLLLHLWTGSPERAKAEGGRVLELATKARQPYLALTAHWALAMLGGLTGESTDIAHHLTEAENLAEQLRSPVLGLWIAEIAIQYRFAAGEWDTALAVAERAIGLARLLNQRGLLPRLLVWTALVHASRGDIATARTYADEAWTVSGAGTDKHDRDVHSVLAAHMGLAYCHMAAGEFEASIRVSEAGIELADRIGYVVWTIYRLVPIAAEASLRMAAQRARPEFVKRARMHIERLRRDSTRFGHRLGLAWADAGDAVIARMRGDHASAAVLLPGAIEKLETVPFVSDGALLRRELAISLNALGDREGALRELRYAHDVFVRLGAKRDIEITRNDIRALGARTPARARAASGPQARDQAGSAPTGIAALLSARELEIVGLVAAGKSNKEVARVLGISPRTVSTHVSNIFGKVGVESRGELAELAHRQGADSTFRREER
ncbi:MAG: AAA family ATPase [Gemmatimonadaceae bacterium]